MILSIENEFVQAKRKSAIPMLWISMTSMFMMFAGLTSAYWVSSGRIDWVSFELPQSFYFSTSFILLSSVTLLLAKWTIQQSKNKIAALLLVATLLLGFTFIYFQFKGFESLMEMGFFFTGPGSSVSASLLFIVALMHIAHLAAGIIVLFVLIFKTLKGKYSSNNLLGLELGSIFWHFVDALWIYLFAFFYFIR